MSWTLGLAIFGALLSLVNTWFLFRKSTTRIRVTPKYYIGNWNEILSYVDINRTSLAGKINRPDGLCIVVQNLSEFPITVSDVGFLDKHSQDRFHLKDFFIGNGGQLPQRVESRASITICTTGVFDAQNIHHRFKSAYITTECGKRITGSCKSMKLDQLNFQ